MYDIKHSQSRDVLRLLESWVWVALTDEPEGRRSPCTLHVLWQEAKRQLHAQSA